jgi:glycosyltransferase involved in cell wall biosynthesis
MNVLHVLEDFVHTGGGLPAVVFDHIGWQRRHGWNARLLHTGVNEVIECAAGVALQSPPNWLGKVWRWSPQLKPSLSKLLSSETDVMHIHGIWMAPQYIASQLAYERAVPSVLSFHGQLHALDQDRNQPIKRLKKTAYLKFVASKLIHRTQVLHAITHLEADVLKSQFPNARIEIIPNSIDVDAAIIQLRACGQQESGHHKIILYLGRLDEQKGVMLLVQAFAQAGLSAEWHLHITGPDSTPGLRQRLFDFVRVNGLQDRIKVSGPVFGADKWHTLQGASLVCLPSKHEVIGLVNLEAAVCAVPVLTSPQTGLEDFEESGGLWVQPELNDIVRKLKQVEAMDESELQQRGVSLRRWVKKKYDSKSVQALWIDLYGSLH